MKSLNVVGKLVVAFGIFAFSAQSQAEDYPGLKGIDLSPAVNFFQAYVHTLSHPVYTWSWFDAGARSTMWRMQFPANDSMGLMHVENAVPLFWEGFCTGDSSMDPFNCAPDQKRLSFGSDNMFGPGLYTAVDPVTTQDYGNVTEGNWVLLQIKLPTGTRIVDSSKDYDFSLPDDVKQLFSTLKCPKYLNGGILRNIFSKGFNRKQNTCKLAMRKIFKDLLQVDAFAYGYQATDYKECSNFDRQQALIITSTRPFESYVADRDHRGEVLAFNSQTSDARADRIRIESFFFKAMGANADANFSRIEDYAIQRLGKAVFPDGSFGDAHYRDDGHLEFTACPRDSIDGTACKKIEIPDSMLTIYPAVLSKVVGPPNFYSNAPLWPDLDGSPTDPGLDKWITENTFHCSEKSDYL